MKQWRYDSEVDLLALKSDFNVICFILIYINLYTRMTIMLFYSMLNGENKTYD